MEVEHDKSTKGAILLRGGASIVATKPVFSSDSKCLLCGSGSVVKVLSVASGECIRELRGHRAKVTGIRLKPDNQFQAFSCSLDQSVIKWDYTDGVLLKRYDFGVPLCALYTTSLKDGTLLLIRHITNQRPDLISCILSRTSSQRVQQHVILPRCNGQEKSVVVFSVKKHTYAAGIGGRRMTITQVGQKDKKTQDRLPVHKLEKDTHFTCVTSHPTELCLATGCSDGKIILWWNILGAGHPVQTTIHWHALPVQDLTFTPEGSYLLSGGHENVLVKWQHNTKHRDTLPRLGAAITGVACSPDNTRYATCHIDNMIQVIGSNLQVQQVFQGLTRGQYDRKSRSIVNMLVDPRTKCLVMNGRPGHLQFYSINTDTHLFSLDIVCQNYISPENLNRPLVITEVEHAMFTENGDWLATLERRDDKETSPEMRLKLWHYDHKAQNYKLNTCVDMPHSQRVNTLKFRPALDEDSSPMAITTSDDGKFKLWQLIDDTDIYRKNECWSCESVGFYRDLPCGDCDFSEDGSLLAIAFESTLTLWNPDTNGLRLTLDCGSDSKIRHVLFGRGPCAQYLICTTSEKLIVWNMLTCSVEWMKEMNVTVLVRDSSTSHMAAFTSTNDLFLFTPSSEQPVYAHHAVSKTSLIGAVFVPRQKVLAEGVGLDWQRKAQLYFLNQNQELLTVQLEPEEHSMEGHQETLVATLQDVIGIPENQIMNESQVVASNLPETPFSQLMSHKRKVLHGDNKSVDAKLGQPGADYLRQMLLTPAHVLPPITSICMSFLDQLVIRDKNDTTKTSDSDDDSDDEDEPEKAEDSDSESEMDTEETAQNQTSASVESKPVLSSLGEYDSLKQDMFNWTSSASPV